MLVRAPHFSTLNGKLNEKLNNFFYKNSCFVLHAFLVFYFPSKVRCIDVHSIHKAKIDVKYVNDKFCFHITGIFLAKKKNMKKILIFKYNYSVTNIRTQFSKIRTVHYQFSTTLFIVAFCDMVLTVVVSS